MASYILSRAQGNKPGAILYNLCADNGKRLMVCAVSQDEKEEFERKFKEEQEFLASHFSVPSVHCVRMELV